MIRATFLLALLMCIATQAHAQTTSTSIQLTWTAPGDDGQVGTATAYDIRYSQQPITAANFSQQPTWAGPSPTIAGSTQTVTVNGLAPSTTYYFALKAIDDAGNVSVMSNVIAKATLPAPDVTAPGAITDLR